MLKKKKEKEKTLAGVILEQTLSQDALRAAERHTVKKTLAPS